MFASVMDEQRLFRNMLHLPQADTGQRIVRDQISVGIREHDGAPFTVCVLLLRPWQAMTIVKIAHTPKPMILSRGQTGQRYFNLYARGCAGCVRR